jgi:hypothetical protein
MKKLLFIPALLWAITLVNGQELFKVPVIPDAEKWEHMAFQANGLMINTINYAKSLGKSVDEVAGFTGNQFKTSWDKEAGFKGFVSGILYVSTAFFPKSTLEILDQSETFIQYRINIAPEFVNSFPIYNVTFDEYFVFWKGVITVIGNYIGTAYTQELKDNVLYVTIKKK